MLFTDIKNVVSNIFKAHNDDAVDRLYNFHTVIGLSIYVLFITSKLYYGEPIQCIVENNNEAVKYIHSMCWLNGTFIGERNDGDISPSRSITYYQWMVFVLLAQCFLFRLPSLLWSLIFHFNGFDIKHVTKNILSTVYLEEYSENANWLKTQRSIEAVADHLRMSFLRQKNYLSKKFNLTPEFKQPTTFEKTKEVKKSNDDTRRQFPNLKTKAIFPLYFPYFFIKLFYLAIIAFNFYMLSWIFGFDYVEFGPVATIQAKDGKYWDNVYFPKKVYCDADIPNKKYDNVGSYVCSLPVNLFHQTFFLAFWYWLWFLAALTVMSIFYWFLLSIKPYRKRLVLNGLQLNSPGKIDSSYTAAYYFNEERATVDLVDNFFINKTNMSLKENFDLFFDHVCSADVIFIMQLITINSNALAFRDILNNLWDTYLDLGEDLKLKEMQHRPMNFIKRPQPPKQIENTVQSVEASDSNV